MIRARYRATNTTVQAYSAGNAFTDLLDLFPNAAAAYSLRKLRAAYSGSAVRVRKEVSLVSSATDIGFLADGSLDTTTLLTFASDADGGNVFVVTWYDQSLSNDATQSTAANQPKIVSSGAVITEGTSAKPAIDFDGTNDALDSIGADLVTGNSAYSVFTVGKSSTTASSDYFWGINATQNGAGVGSISSFTPEFAIRVSGNVIFSDAASGSQELLSVLYDGTTIQNHALFIDGVSSAVSSSSNGSNPMNIAAGDFRIGGWGVSPGFLDGNLQELILYDSDQSASRTGVEANVNDFYSIY